MSKQVAAALTKHSGVNFSQNESLQHCDCGMVLKHAVLKNCIINAYVTRFWYFIFNIVDQQKLRWACTDLPKTLMLTYTKCECR